MHVASALRCLLPENCASLLAHSSVVREFVEFVAPPLKNGPFIGTVGIVKEHGR